MKQLLLTLIKVILYGYLLLILFFGMAMFASGHNIPSKTKTYLAYNIIGTILGIVIATYYSRKKNGRSQSAIENDKVKEDSTNYN